MTIGFRSCQFWKKGQFVLEVLIFSLSHGKRENLAETPVLKDFFFFCSKWSPFSKMLVSNGDIKFP